MHLALTRHLKVSSKHLEDLRSDLYLLIENAYDLCNEVFRATLDFGNNFIVTFVLCCKMYDKFMVQITPVHHFCNSGIEYLNNPHIVLGMFL